MRIIALLFFFLLTTMEGTVMPYPVQQDGLGMGWIGGLLIGTLLGRGGLGWLGGYGDYGRGPAAAAVATDVVLNPAFQGIQNQISTLSDTISSQNISNAMSAWFTSVNNSVHEISDVVNSGARDILGGISNLATAQAAGNFTTLTSINGLGRDITAAQNQSALQQLNSFNQLTTTTLQGFNSQAMQIQNATNQIIAQGTANAAAMAACCCEIKETISRDGGETRALITSNRMNDLESQLSEARLSASQSAQTNALIAALQRNGNGND